MAIPVLAAAAASAGIGAAGNIANSGMNFAFNKHLQEDSQRFNALEAQKSRDFTAQENILNRDFNSAEAQKSRDFQEYMAETNYQRTISDMEKAGINPASLGASGATGTGSAGASASYSSAGSVASGSSGIGRVSLGDFFNNALINAFQDKDVIEAFANKLKSNAKEVKPLDDSSNGVTPYDIMSPQQIKDHQSYTEKYGAQLKGWKVHFTKDELKAKDYYDDLVQSIWKANNPKIK